MEDLAAALLLFQYLHSARGCNSPSGKDLLNWKKKKKLLLQLGEDQLRRIPLVKSSGPCVNDDGGGVSEA